MCFPVNGLYLRKNRLTPQQSREIERCTACVDPDQSPVDELLNSRQERVKNERACPLLHAPGSLNQPKRSFGYSAKAVALALKFLP